MKPRTLEILQKSEAGAPEPTAGEAFDTALAGLTEELEKAKKNPAEPKPKKEEDDDDDKGEGGDEEGLDAAADGEGEDKGGGNDDDETPELPLDKPKGKKKGMKKSLAEEVAGASPEAEAAMDVEPFLKAMTDVVGARIAELESQVVLLAKSLTSIAQTLASHSKVLVAEGNMLKSVLGMDPASQATPLPRQSQLSTIERFTKSHDGSESALTDGQARAQLIRLAKSNLLSPSQVSIVEGRLNKSQPLPEFFLNTVKTNP